MTGISNVYSKYGYTYLNTLSRRLYKEIRAYNTRFASKAGIPRSIRVTTIKPEGSLSIILECNNGVHFPICQYAKRRIAISKTSDILQPLLDAGFPTEQSIYDTNMVYVIFPVEFEGRPTKKVSIFEQCCLSSSMQRLFSDNSVSFTGHFSIERESQDVERVLAMFAPVIKSMSMFPYSDDVSKEKVYQHMPFEEITKEEYEALLKTVKPVQWNNKGIDAIAERGCTNDTCSWN